MFRLSVLAHPLGARILKRCVRTALFFCPWRAGWTRSTGLVAGGFKRSDQGPPPLARRSKNPECER
jgi:hypothetical protein